MICSCKAPFPTTIMWDLDMNIKKVTKENDININNKQLDSVK